MLRHFLLALAVTAAPAFCETVYSPELLEGYPPKMGEVSGSFAGVPVSWETFDFSIGAFDASAWVGAGYETPAVTLHLMAYPPGEPDTMEGRIYAEAGFGAEFRTGKGRDVRVEVYQGEDRDGPRLSSDGRKARLVVETIGPASEDSYNRHVTGRIEARLCPVDWPGASCQDLVLTFDTDVQMETTVIVAD